MNDFTYVAPPEDGLRQAMVHARARRLRTAGFSTSTLLAAFALLAAIAGGQGTQSLIEQPAPEQPAITTVVPGPVTQDGGTSNSVGATTFTTTQSRSVAGSGGTTGTTPSGATGGSAETSAPAQVKPYVAGPINTGSSVYVPSTECHVTGNPEDATTLCPSSYVYGQYQSPTPYLFQLYADVCSTRAGITTLHFPGRNEVDLAVYSGTTEVWRWSRWHPDGGSAHSVSLATEDCTTWTFDWTGVDAHGMRLPKGDYTLRASFLATELTGRSTPSVTFTVS